MNPELLARFSAYAVEKYPVKTVTIMQPIDMHDAGTRDYCSVYDTNEPLRSAFLSGLIACYEKFGREIAEAAWKERASYELPMACETKKRIEYLKRFLEPDKKD